MPELTLYYTDACPFCQKVLNFMRDQNIDIPKKDIMEDESIYRELFDIGGKGQVPCLVIDGKALYESLDIIAWLKENYQA